MLIKRRVFEFNLYFSINTSINKPFRMNERLVALKLFSLPGYESAERKIPGLWDGKDGDILLQ